ncbi:pimeloyl-ACP methyl ester carboxylesterase [Duganella sp. SG902]|nr:pimeloyl-ACP methyl ester carboxylesterase [Duganella sp. SG902]
MEAQQHRHHHLIAPDYPGFGNSGTPCCASFARVEVG